MFLYRQSVYRKEASPDWKKMYDDALASGTVPSWDEMFEILLNDGMLETPLEETLRYNEDGDEERALAEVKESLSQEYYENVLTAISFTNEEECFRRICIDRMVHPIDIDPIGIYWSRGSSGADCYWDDEDKPYWYLFRAQVNPEGIDIPETVRMNMINEEEYEVRFHKGTRIWVKDVEIDLFKSAVPWRDVDWSDEADLDRWEEQYEGDLDKREFEKTFPINDWRMT